jgi:hypothetical protein
MPLIATFALVFTGCSSIGAGMQATPPAPIAQTGGSAGYASSETSKDAATEDAPAAKAEAPSSEPVVEDSITTGGGGRFLLL